MSKNKRKEYKDNPYTIYIEDNKYYIKFNNKTLEIEKEIYDVINLFIIIIGDDI